MVVQAAKNHADKWSLTEIFDEGYIEQFEARPYHKI